MPPTTPYSKYLGDRDPIESMRQMIDRVRDMSAAWAPADFERTYAPGKWTARQILTHLAQAELALGNRARMALTTKGYVAQAFDQDAWVARETDLSGIEAAESFTALARMNMRLFESLSPTDRAIALSHPEYGALTVDWIVHTIAGHQLNHLAQLEAINQSGPGR